MAKQDEQSINVQDGLPEAANSANFLMIDPKTDTWVQFTTRADNWAAVKAAVREGIDELAEDGWLSRYRWDQQSGSFQQAPNQSSSNGGGNQGQDDNTFQATSILKSMTDGKWYFKIKGIEGKFPKWPVTIWPEILEEAGISSETFIKSDVAEMPLKAGTVAHYVKNEKGNPAKVISLQDPGAMSSQNMDQPAVPAQAQPQAAAPDRAKGDTPAGWPQLWNEVSVTLKDANIKMPYTLDQLKEAVGGQVDFDNPEAVVLAINIAVDTAQKEAEVPF